MCCTNKEKKHDRKRFLCFTVFTFIAVITVTLLGGCRTSAVEYTITVKGSAGEAGVIRYAGLEMNVYQDPASNPCGDCPDQPVSIYVGTDAGKTAEAMAEAIRRADDIWEVKSCSQGILILTEKEPGTVKEEPLLSAPQGLELTGEYHA
ncbi:MAG: hypothetical protein J5898_04710 [Lachnospiraceae bacterium]|nr:hypothetical protein [Lachnospiraceae bacterium]